MAQNYLVVGNDISLLITYLDRKTGKPIDFLDGATVSAQFRDGPSQSDNILLTGTASVVGQGQVQIDVAGSDVTPDMEGKTVYVDVKVEKESKVLNIPIPPIRLPIYGRVTV